MRTSFSGSKKKKGGQGGRRDSPKKAKIERILIKVNGLLKRFRRKESKKRFSWEILYGVLEGENCPRAGRLNLFGFFLSLGKQELLQCLDQY